MVCDLFYCAICRDDGLPRPFWIFDCTPIVCPFQGEMSRSDKGVTIHKKILLDFKVSIGIKGVPNTFYRSWYFCDYDIQDKDGWYHSLLLDINDFDNLENVFGDHDISRLFLLLQITK